MEHVARILQIRMLIKFNNHIWKKETT